MGDKCPTHAAQGTQSERQVSGGDKWETSVKSCGPRHPVWVTSGSTSVNSCGPRHPEWETSWETSVGDKCKLMRPKAPRVGDKCGRQGGDKTHAVKATQSGPKCGTQCGRQVWETSVNSCGPSHPEWETSVGDKCKLMRPKTPRVRDKCGTQVGVDLGHECNTHAAQGTQSG